MPDTQKDRPVDGPPTHNNPRTTLPLPTDTWSVIARGWVNAGGAMPPLCSPTWRTLPDGDPVKAAVVEAARLGVLDLVNAGGPANARRATVQELEAA